MRRTTTSTHHRTRILVAGAALSGGLVASIVFSLPATAVEGWSRTPSAGTAGASVHVASSPATLCQWVQPDPVTNEPQTFDGTSVDVRLQHDGNTTGLGRVEVTPGGAWAGSVTVPEPTVIGAGDYDLIARCVIDRPEVTGLQTFDFDALGFAVVDAPPPTSITIPTELVPPITITNPDRVEVQGAELNRSPATPVPAVAANATEVPTLPKTGDGTLAIALSGFGALALGAGALWWGARYARKAEPI